MERVRRFSGAFVDALLSVGYLIFSILTAVVMVLAVMMGVLAAAHIALLLIEQIVRYFT